MMRYFKDLADGFYLVDGADFAPEWVEITEDEWLAQNPIVVPDPKDAIRAQIKQLEAEQLMPRATREFMLTFMEMNAPAEVLAVNPGYQAVKAFDNQIKALRDLL
jgi:hypothetical protein